MISIFWAFFIGIFGATIGLLFAAILFASGRADDRIEKMKEIDEVVEEIVETFIENADCEHDFDPGGPNYPGHHDISYDISKAGTEKIRKILEELA